MIQFDLMLCFDLQDGDIEDCVLCLQMLVDFVGQVEVCVNLWVFIESVWMCGKVMDYMLFYGFLGLGKMMLVQIMVCELGVNFKMILGLVLVCVGDFVVILINLEVCDVLFIDEIYCMNLVVEEVFYLVMEDFELDLVIGEGFVVCIVWIELQFFMLVGVMMWLGFLIMLLCDCFGILMWL